MCARVVLATPVKLVAERFGVAHPDADLPPRYNIAPSQELAVVVNQGRNRLVGCRWGFTPRWARDLSEGQRMINARAETVAEKPAFREAFRSGRCLVAVDGFFEWRRNGKTRTPFYTRLRSGRPMGLAGLTTTWPSGEKEPVCTCTIITTEANEALMPIHPRMPVIIPEADEPRWLDPGNDDLAGLTALLRPSDAGGLETYEVTRAVNSPRNDSPENVRPVGPS